VSSNYFSTKPVLKCLQQMPGVPLAQELVSGQHPAPTEYLDAARSALEQVSKLWLAWIMLRPLLHAGVVM
jgi:hypothetical protein